MVVAADWLCVLVVVPVLVLAVDWVCVGVAVPVLVDVAVRVTVGVMVCVPLPVWEVVSVVVPVELTVAPLGVVEVLAVLGERGLKDGKLEIKWRWDKQAEMIDLDTAAATIVGLIEEERAGGRRFRATLK